MLQNKKTTENDSRQITYGTSQGVWNNNSGIAKRRAYKANYGASRWFKRKHDTIEKNKSRVQESTCSSKETEREVGMPMNSALLYSRILLKQSSSH